MDFFYLHFLAWQGFGGGVISNVGDKVILSHFVSLLTKFSAYGIMDCSGLENINISLKLGKK